MMMNRNKKGIAINLKEKDGINIFKSMVKTSDVVIENYRKGTMDKLGIGYDELKKLIQKLYYVKFLVMAGQGHMPTKEVLI